MSADLVFVHLSDPHLPADPTARLFGASPDDNLRRAVDYVAALPVAPAFCLVSGDLTDDGAPAGYRRLTALLAPLAARGVPVLLGLGNHDDRAVFRREALGEAAPDGDARPYCYSRLIGGLRVLMLDSLVPGAVHGALGAGQVAWLDEQVRRPAPGGDLIVVHHPVQPVGMPWLDGELLRDAPALAGVLAGRRILGVLAGHCHGASLAAFAGTVAVTAPATVFQFEPYPRDDAKVRAGTGLNLCAVNGGRLIVTPVILPAPASPRR